MYSKETVSAKEQDEHGKIQKEGVKQKLKKVKVAHHVLLFTTHYSPWYSSGQNTGVGSCSLLQGIFPTQGSNPGLPHCRQILYQLKPKNTVVSSLSCLQQIFPTQESNWGLLPCRRIL